jgi:ribosomal protein S18 acetylase RimI-like enzyme
MSRRYPPPAPADGDTVFLASLAGRPVGFAHVQLEAWNRRGVIRDIAVSASSRRAGIGRALVSACHDWAAAVGARCLWLETQNVNAPAIQFYRRLGFVLCGLDVSLYDTPPRGVDEVALFFSRPI